MLNNFNVMVISIPGEPKTARKAGTSEIDGVLSKNPGFWISQFSISALSHKVLPLMLKNQQCSYQHAASGLVSCRARDFVGELFLHFSNAWSTTFLRKCSDKQCQFLHTRYIHNNLNRVFANKYFTMSKRPVFSWILSVQTISGPKSLLWQPTGQTPKTHNFFTGSHGLITCFFTGFLKAGVLFKIRKYEFSTG